MANTLFTSGEAAELISEPGFGSKKASDRWHLLKRGDRGGVTFIHNYGRVDERGIGRYTLAEVCKAKVLFALIDTGVADRAVLRAADFGMIGHHPETPEEAERMKGAPSPIKMAVDDIRAGDMPTFVLTRYTHDQTGETKFVARIVPEGDHLPAPPKSVEAVRDPSVPTAFVPRSMIVIDLAPLLLPIIKRGMN